MAMMKQLYATRSVGVSGCQQRGRVQRLTKSVDERATSGCEWEMTFCVDADNEMVEQLNDLRVLPLCIESFRRIRRYVLLLHTSSPQQVDDSHEKRAAAVSHEVSSLYVAL